MKQKPAAIHNAVDMLDPVAKKMLYDQRVSIILKDFHGVNWHKQMKVLPVFTVFYNPDDYPGKYVVRLFDCKKPTRLITVCDSLKEARHTIPAGYIMFGRAAKDPPVIVETWI